MSLKIGETIGAYHVSAPLGKGGMGEVWRAEDTSLGREVALKVLPEELEGDPERLSRFEREARLLAALNHPNVATLYGLELLGGRHVLVMELVEGRGLDEVIEGGPIPYDDAVAISLQLADALEAAHAQGIVHRDLKPANIRIRPDGAVKVLDFGLAKAWQTDDTEESLSLSPTMTRHATIEGVILGTAAYMSPEQARGQAVDKRADIWAFGVVLWQMLTGRRLFEGDTVSDTLASVLKEEPDMAVLPDSTTSSVRRLLRRCLQKDPRNRLHDMADARLELNEEPDDGPKLGDFIPASQPGIARRVLPWAVAGLALLSAIWAWIGSSNPEAPRQRLVASIPAPASGGFLVSTGFAISPDGSRVVFGAREGEDSEHLWLRSLEDGSSTPLAGTQRGRLPFWSPDGRSIGFFADTELKKLSLDNGVVETLTDAPGRASGAWSHQGIIVFTSASGLSKIPANGGSGDTILSRDGDLEYLSPSFLPDGNHFLYLKRIYGSTEEKHELRVGSLDGRTDVAVLASNSAGVFAPSGDLLWWQDGHLRAQALDLESFQLEGESRLLHPDVLFDPRIGLGMFSVAANGTIVFRTGTILAGEELVLVDREGHDLDVISDSGNFYNPRLSPDGTMVAVDKSDVTNRGDIWIYDVERGSGTRLTSAAQDESVPVWSPDGRQIAFYSTRDIVGGAAHIRSVRGGDDERLIFGDESKISGPWSWSQNGLIVIEYSDATMGEDGDLGIFSVQDETLKPLLTTPFIEKHGVISPDEKLIAFQSNETGRFEIYVQTFPEPVNRWRVSTRGGSGPVWRRDGRELFFITDENVLMAVPIRAGSNIAPVQIGSPETLFSADLKPSSSRQTIDTLDGRTFLVNRSVGDYETAPLTLIVNAFARKNDSRRR